MKNGTPPRLAASMGELVQRKRDPSVVVPVWWDERAAVACKPTLVVV